MLITQALAAAAQKASSQPGMLDLGLDTRFGDIPKRVARLSYLYQNEIGQGARVAILARNRGALPLTIFALANTRAILIPIDPDCGAEQVELWLKGSEATHLAVSADCLIMARDILKNARLSLPLIEFEKKTGGEYDSGFAPPPDSPPKDSDPVLLLRTAGTQGAPRFVAFDHNRMLHFVAALRAHYRASMTDRFCTLINWSHPFAFVHGMLFPLLNGNTCVVEPGLEPKDSLKYFREAKVTRLSMAPGQARDLLNYMNETQSRIPLLKSITVGLGEITPELEALAQSSKIPLLRSYGQAENGWTGAMDDFAESSRQPKPAMKALTGLKYKVLDSNGDTIEGKGERTGMLAIAGPSVMLGYRGPQKEKKECETATKMRLRGSWLFTGDIATLVDDEDGTVRISVLGRKEQLLESQGGFISPGAIDRALKEIPGVVDGAGFVTNDLGGKPVLACAVLREETSPLRPQDILLKLRERLSPERAPVAVVWADSIRRNLAGVNRGRLSRQFSGISPTDLSAPPAAAAAAGDGATPAQVAVVPSSPDPSPVVEVPEPEAPDSVVAAPPVAATVAATRVPVLARPAAEKQAFITCALEEIIPNEPLPVTIHLFYQQRFIPYIQAGRYVDRAAYDRLQFRRITHFFIREQDGPAFSAWSRLHADAATGSEPGLQGVKRLRKRVRQQTIAYFQIPRPEVEIQKLLESTGVMVEEVVNAPFLARPLAHLQTLAAGTIDHSLNVSILSVYLALHMGYSHQLILKNIGAGALLHDFGKTLIVPAERATPQVRDDQLKMHPLLAAENLGKEAGITTEVKTIVAQHAECHDGSGFPKGLRGSAIYDLARIVSIADQFDNLVSGGTGTLPERQRWALQEISGPRKACFEPQKLDKAVKILSVGFK